MTQHRPSSILLQTTLDRHQDDLQRGLALPIAQLQKLIPLNGAYLTSGVSTTSGAVLSPISFAPSDTVLIYHKLGRAYQGYVLCNQEWTNGGAGTFPFITINGGNSETKPFVLALSNFGTATVTADVWVY